MVSDVTAMEESVITVKLTGWPVTPDIVAVILVVPAATAVAKPDDEIVATVGLELDRVHYW